MIKALFADDEQDLCELVEIEFELSENEVICCTSGNDAFKKFKSTKFDIIITDENMPDGTGLELIKSVRSDNSNIPIIIALSEFDREKREIASKEKNIFFIQKPYDMSDLLEQIKEILKS